MTWPVTPDPSIHDEPPSVAAANQQQQADQIRALLAKLPAQIIAGLVNAIMTALGLGGYTGDVDAALSDIESGLGGLVSDVEAASGDVTTLVDDLYTALGGSGSASSSGVESLLTTLVSDVTTALGNWTTLFSDLSTGNLAGLVTFLEGLLPTSTFTTLVNDVFSGLGGSGTASSSGIESLLTAFFGGSGSWQTLLNALQVGLGGSTPGTPSEIQTLLTGWFGSSGSVASLLSSLSTLGSNVGDLSNLLNTVQSTANSAATIAEAASATLAAQTLYQKLFHAVDPTLEGVFNLTSLTGNSPSTLSVTAADSVIGFVNIGTTATKSTLAWYGGGVTNLTAAYVNVYSVDTSTGELTNVWASGNVLSYISSAVGWVYVPISTPIDVTQGQVYAIELQVEGSGTHAMVGLPGHWLAANTAVYPQQLAASRTAVTTPSYGATGAGNYGSSSTLSWSDTSPSGADVFAWVATYTTATASSVKYNGVSMTEVGSVYNDANSSDGQLSLWHLAEAGTGSAETVLATFSASGDCEGCSTSYANVGSVGTPATVDGSGSSLSQSVTCAAGQIILQAFSQRGHAISSPSGGTNRYNSYEDNVALCINDATATATFTGTGSFDDWAGLAVVLNGTPISAPSTISSPTYSSNVPWLALSSNTEGTSGTYAPETTDYTTAGTYTWTPPSWANYVDLIGCGGGGAGQGEQGYNLGQGGLAGDWNETTLTIGSTGTDLPPGNSITVTVGAGGAQQVTYFANGNPGSATTFQWTDASGTNHTLTCAGGAGGSGTGVSYDGASPGNETYNSETYTGGTAAASGATGNAPGGGGGGAPPYLFGGAGAPGGAWAVARQS